MADNHDVLEPGVLDLRDRGRNPARDGGRRAGDIWSWQIDGQYRQFGRLPGKLVDGESQQSPACSPPWTRTSPGNDCFTKCAKPPPSPK
jgi:hypothetical protein